MNEVNEVESQERRDQNHSLTSDLRSMTTHVDLLLKSLLTVTVVRDCQSTKSPRLNLQCLHQSWNITADNGRRARGRESGGERDPDAGSDLCLWILSTKALKDLFKGSSLTP